MGILVILTQKSKWLLTPDFADMEVYYLDWAHIIANQLELVNMILVRTDHEWSRVNEKNAPQQCNPVRGFVTRRSTCRRDKSSLLSWRWGELQLSGLLRVTDLLTETPWSTLLGPEPSLLPDKPRGLHKVRSYLTNSLRLGFSGKPPPSASSHSVAEISSPV